jgi:hypothetical protein
MTRGSGRRNSRARREQQIQFVVFLCDQCARVPATPSMKQLRGVAWKDETRAFVIIAHGAMKRRGGFVSMRAHRRSRALMNAVDAHEKKLCESFHARRKTAP